MKAKGITLGAAALLVALVLGACGTSQPLGGADPGNDDKPSTVTHTEDNWTIVTPVGWIRTDITKDADAKKAIRYAHADGRYVIVAIDPQGSGYESDTVWRYEVKGNRFEIVTKDDCTGGQGCSTDDKRYDGYVFSKNTGAPPKVAGHEYYFIFGDTDSTTIDASAFETIIESLEAK